ncbi:MAG: hypothetical protein A3D44_03965 [Candidatus Staskawiczbacteria bacterium RIFCSPHIGHO2_02_FULL_42_22]|uniref:GerMN domain-containing protein n=1 Tax=Candidatus Staskawiczbacteria bacterium RIFCSPHIGHO2_02_FULL_42_22 TaxID=1802207 RepID=A0A1G2I1J4_9BACT|nr:MAG: hypothetical protein A3D44_03965 [Candidatus Staskawiczbacteria bacterium RIFCSPHIGHO2_02_FULL_42_22]
MNQKIILALIIGVVVLVLAGVAWMLFFSNAPVNNGIGQNPSNVIIQGIITKDTPGARPGVWYITYEEPGSPALRKELDVSAINFTNKYLYNGQTARVEGYESNNVVKVTTLQILNVYKDDLIWAASPLPNDVLVSPIMVTGQARGNWFFEASFPVALLDANGKVLAQVPAQAQSEWMTTDYVGFGALLPFLKPATSTGTLVLQKDNPSGLPEHADELRIPVRFETAEKTVTLYYYNANNDKDASGNIMCSSQGLVGVVRRFPISTTPIQDAIKLLLQGQLTAVEKSQGISTEYPLPGVSLKSANLKDGVLTLEFSDPQNKTGGGSCRVGILWKQIESTAKQFPEVKSVRFIPEELFQP